MKKNNFSDMITSVDVLNTLNGGVSEPTVTFQKYDNRNEIHVYVPGINKADIHIEIDKNILTIFYSISIASTNLMIPMPRIVYSKNIPYFVDITKISAQTEGNGLVVTLPFNRMANGYFRDVKLDEV